MEKVNIIGTVLFVLAVLHTFSVGIFHRLANRYPEGSIGENFFHLLGEVEVVFGFWAGLLVLFFVFWLGTEHTVFFMENLNFTEPAFVFVIMAMAATKPVLFLAEQLVNGLSSLVKPSQYGIFKYFIILFFTPILGSFITEPAAMTVAAMLLLDSFLSPDKSRKFKYVTLAVLFVNISIGGTLTHFAAPPVVMVAQSWGWDTQFMLTHFGYKAVLAVLINALIASYALREDLKLVQKRTQGTKQAIPYWLVALHLLFIGLVVFSAHHPIIFIGLFLFFLGLVDVTKEYQSALQLKSALLVAFFLGGLVVLGKFQAWWLEPIITTLGDYPLFISATLLTAVTDNAALTYLGSLVPSLSASAQYFLVAGAVSGGGLTIIANAPNPVGFSILKEVFAEDGLRPALLFKFALLPTLVALIFFAIPG